MSAFGYFGSKLRIAAKLKDELPAHSMWVELFCGSAAMTLAKKPADSEVINDTHGDIVNFFKQLRNHGEELCRLIELTPYSRREFELSRIDDPNASDLERARRFFIAAMMAINGSFGKRPGGFSISDSYTRGGMEARVNRWNAMPEYLREVVSRLKSVRVEDQDALELFKKYKRRPATLVYFDPPYFADRAPGYDHDQIGEEFHKKLLESVQDVKCMVFISGYDSELYNKSLSTRRGWTKRVLAATTKGVDGRSLARQEVVWFNEPYTHAVANGAPRLRLSKQEVRDKKLNPER